MTRSATVVLRPLHAACVAAVLAAFTGAAGAAAGTAPAGSAAPAAPAAPAGSAATAGSAGSAAPAGTARSAASAGPAHPDDDCLEETRAPAPKPRPVVRKRVTPVTAPQPVAQRAEPSEATPAPKPRPKVVRPKPPAPIARADGGPIRKAPIDCAPKAMRGAQVKSVVVEEAPPVASTVEPKVSLIDTANVGGTPLTGIWTGVPGETRPIDSTPIGPTPWFAGVPPGLFVPVVPTTPTTPVPPGPPGPPGPPPPHGEVPLPGTGVLLAIGLAAVGLSGRRRPTQAATQPR